MSITCRNRFYRFHLEKNGPNMFFFMLEKFTIFEFGGYLRAFSVIIRHVFFDNIFYNWLLFILPYVILMVYHSSGILFVVFFCPVWWKFVAARDKYEIVMGVAVFWHIFENLLHRFDFLRKIPPTFRIQQAKTVQLYTTLVILVALVTMNEYVNNCKSSCKGNAHYMRNVVNVCLVNISHRL